MKYEPLVLGELLDTRDIDTLWCLNLGCFPMKFFSKTTLMSISKTKLVIGRQSKNVDGVPVAKNSVSKKQLLYLK